MSQVDSKTRIIQAAIIEFSDKGKAGARMDRIAAEAGVNKAMLYYYYSSKDALFIEALRDIFQFIMEKQRYFAGVTGPWRERLREMVSHIVDTFQERPELIRLLMHEVLSGEQNLAKAANELSPGQAIPYATGIAEILFEGIERGELRGTDIIQITINIMSLCYFHTLFFPMIKAIWNEPDLDEEAFIARRKEYILDLLEFGLLTGRCSDDP